VAYQANGEAFTTTSGSRPGPLFAFALALASSFGLAAPVGGAFPIHASALGNANASLGYSVVRAGVSVSGYQLQGFRVAPNASVRICVPDSAYNGVLLGSVSTGLIESVGGQPINYVERWWDTFKGPAKALFNPVATVDDLMVVRIHWNKAGIPYVLEVRTPVIHI
jgi:hypothetical protein